MGCRCASGWPLTRFGDSGRIRAVKIFVPLLAFVALTFSACSSDSARRGLYQPKQSEGYWTRQLETKEYKQRELADARYPGAQQQEAEPAKKR